MYNCLYRCMQYKQLYNKAVTRFCRCKMTEVSALWLIIPDMLSWHADLERDRLLWVWFMTVCMRVLNNGGVWTFHCWYTSAVWATVFVWQEHVVKFVWTFHFFPPCFFLQLLFVLISSCTQSENPPKQRHVILSLILEDVMFYFSVIVISSVALDSTPLTCHPPLSSLCTLSFVISFAFHFKHDLTPASWLVKAPHDCPE